MKRFVCAAISAVLLLPLIANAADYRRLAESELTKLDYFNAEHWSFTLTREEDGDTTVARHSAERPAKQRWLLVSRNNKPASYDDMQGFRADMAKEQARLTERREEAIEEGEPVEGGLVAMIDWDTLEVADETDQRAVLHFQPMLARFDEDENALLTGTLTIDKQKQQLLSLEIFNKDFVPSDDEDEAPSFEQFTFKARFTYQQGMILLEQMVTEVHEPAGLFGSGEEREALSYSDYKPLKIKR